MSCKILVRSRNSDPTIKYEGQSCSLLDCRDYFLMFLLVGILSLFLTYFLMPSKELRNNLVYSNVLIIAHYFQINYEGMTFASTY